MKEELADGIRTIIRNLESHESMLLREFMKHKEAGEFKKAALLDEVFVSVGRAILISKALLLEIE